MNNILEISIPEQIHICFRLFNLSVEYIDNIRRKIYKYEQIYK